MILSTSPSISPAATPIPVVGPSRNSTTSYSYSSATKFPARSMAPTGNVNRGSGKTTAPASAMEARFSLVFALAVQTSSVSQRFPDLETVRFKVLKRDKQYEIREVEHYFIAETTMPGKYGFDFSGASQSFNNLAEYLFGKNTREKQMAMTTPVFTRKTEPQGEKMDMTTPVITRRGGDNDKWMMSFVMPSKYGADLPLPKDSSVTIKEVPKRVIAVAVFSGFVTDEEVERRESMLRRALIDDFEFRVREGASVEVAQYNPPFTLPFNRRNEVALEVERREI